MIVSRRLALGLLAGAVVAPSVVRAQGSAAGASVQSSAAGAWAPTRPITLVVPYPAGGPTDAIGRIVAKELEIVFKVKQGDRFSVEITDE